MSSPGSPTLILDAPIRRAERAIAAIALAAVGAVPWVVLPAARALVYGLCGVLIVALAAWRAGWLGQAHRITRLRWHADGRWTLSTACQPPREARLLADSRVAAGFVWLRWRTGPRPWNRVRSMLITASDLSPADWRRLAVRLRLQGRTSLDVPLFPAP